MGKIRIMRKQPKYDPNNSNQDIHQIVLHPDQPEQIEMQIEKLFPRGTKYKGVSKQRGSFKDLQAGIFGMHRKTFEIPREGTVIYDRYLITGGYVAEIELLGFKEQSDVYKNLKYSLEKIAAQNTNPL